MVICCTVKLTSEYDAAAYRDLAHAALTRRFPWAHVTTCWELVARIAPGADDIDLEVDGRNGGSIVETAKDAIRDFETEYGCIE